MMPFFPPLTKGRCLSRGGGVLRRDGKGCGRFRRGCWTPPALTRRLPFARGGTGERAPMRLLYPPRTKETMMPPEPPLMAGTHLTALRHRSYFLKDESRLV